MNHHQRCLQAKVKYRNEPKQVMPKSEDLSMSLEIKPSNLKVTNRQDITDLLAKTFSKNSSSDKYNKQYQNIKNKAEKTK